MHRDMTKTEVEKDYFTMNNNDFMCFDLNFLFELVRKCTFGAKMSIHNHMK